MLDCLSRFHPHPFLRWAAGQFNFRQNRKTAFRITRAYSESLARGREMTAPEVVPVTIGGRLYRTVKEGQANILAPYSQDTAKLKAAATQPGQPRNNDEGDQAVFYNPIQQYNRDLSVLAILVYGESALQVKRAKHEKMLRLSQRRKKNKTSQISVDMPHDSTMPSSEPATRKRKIEDASLDENGECEVESVKKVKSGSTEPNGPEIAPMSKVVATTIPDLDHSDIAATTAEGQKSHHDALEKTSKPRRTPFTILDALSASGLRAIRYAKEIDFSTTVIANDYSPEAVKAIELNVQHNDLKGKVFSNQGDARQYMYSKTGNESAQRGPGYVHRFDVVDLDPYGSAAPFLDAAIQAIADGGMLCVTCTDGGVWASNGYPEKAYAIYAGIPLKGPHSHEAGLRIILHSIAVSAAKYGVAIEPLLSLSIDFYARLFIRVHKSQQDVKLMAGTTMLVYNCDQGCGAWQTQLVARNQERKAKNNETYYKHGFAQAPSTERFCEHCGTKSHLGGPMWAGPLHNPAFIQKILDRLPHVDKTIYGTTERIKGMLTVALEEEDITIPPPKEDTVTKNIALDTNSTEDFEKADTTAIIPRLPAHLICSQPLFFLPTYLSKILSLPTPSDDPFRGAFIALGYTCTRSHCKPGSFKTDAPWNVIWEIMREWARQKEPNRIPRLLGEGEFEDNASVKKTSPGAKILTRLRNRSGKALQVAQLKDRLLEKLGNGAKSADVENSDDLRNLLTSTLYDLEHLAAETNNTPATSNGTSTYEKSAETVKDFPKISGKALIENGGDPSELDIVFDSELGGAFRESKGGRLVRYQINPRPNWGPMNRAGAGT